MAMRVQTEGTNHTKSRKENRDNRMTELLMNFCRCGIAGWCLEVMFTSVDSIMAGDWTLMGQTSLLMFPIYGWRPAVSNQPLHRQLAYGPAGL